jgi:hypothetical protein
VTIATNCRTEFATIAGDTRLGGAVDDSLAWWPNILVIKKDICVYTALEQWLRTTLRTIVIVAYRGVVTAYLTVVAPVVEVTRIEVQGRYYGPLPNETRENPSLDTLTENVPIIVALVLIPVIAVWLFVTRRREIDIPKLRNWFKKDKPHEEMKQSKSER